MSLQLVRFAQSRWAIKSPYCLKTAKDKLLKDNKMLSKSTGTGNGSNANDITSFYYYPILNNDEFLSNPIDTEPRPDLTKEIKVHGDDYPLELSSEGAHSFLSPIPNGIPPAIFLVGLNYAKHIKEVGWDAPKLPVISMKNPASVIGNNSVIRIPKCTSKEKPEVDFEAELAVIIGKKCTNVSEEKAKDYILGYTCANDVTARRIQGKKGGNQWVRSKSFDTFCPLGPSIILNRKDMRFDPNNARIWSRLSKKSSPFLTTQDSNTSEMTNDCAKLVSFISQDTTLLPWTVILTGTPAGVGYTRNPPLCLEAGDEIVVGIEGIGELRSKVEDA